MANTFNITLKGYWKSPISNANTYQEFTTICSASDYDKKTVSAAFNFALKHDVTVWYQFNGYAVGVEQSTGDKLHDVVTIRYSSVNRVENCTCSVKAARKYIDSMIKKNEDAAA